MEFYKFTADNTPISSNVAAPDVSATIYNAGELVNVGKTKYSAKLEKVV